MTRLAEVRDLDELVAHPHPANPKAHDLETLSASIRRFGFAEPVVVDGRTGLVLSGHGRVEALAAMRDAGEQPPDGVDESDGWWVPTYTGWASSNDDEAAAALVALNRITETGGWVDRSLADLLTDLQSLDDGLVGVGYTDDDLAELRAMLGDTAPDFEPVEGDEQPRLDERTPIECGACGATIDPSSGEVRA